VAAGCVLFSLSYLLVACLDRSVNEDKLENIDAVKIASNMVESDPQVRVFWRRLLLSVLAVVFVALGASIGAVSSGLVGAIAGVAAGCVLFSLSYLLVACLDRSVNEDKLENIDAVKIASNMVESDPQVRVFWRRLLLSVLAVVFVALGASIGAVSSGLVGAIAGVVAGGVLFSVTYRLVACLDRSANEDKLENIKIDKSPLKATDAEDIAGSNC